ncbi:MAG: twin-arginine translocase TatA/TatE family subunit [Alphaproteobacteria bacterium]|nr:twin-arginine translocase TatA/TatE family subunit [Alphaproteobacteria bacterium]
MGSFSIWHWLVVLVVVLLLFGGKGKISGLMGDFGKGLKNFKQGMKSEDEEADSANKSVADDSGTKQNVDKTTDQTVKS